MAAAGGRQTVTEAASSLPRPLLRHGAGAWAWRVFILALFAVPAVTNGYTQYVVNLAVVYALAATGFNLVIGYLGQIAFGNAALLGLGAYMAGILMSRYGLPFPLALVAGGAAGAFGGVVFSLPALRGVRFFYLGILTLAVGELLRWTYNHASGLTGGSTGLAMPAPTLLGYPLQSQVALYYVFLVVAVLLIAGTRNLLRSRVGRAVVAVRENELAAAALGIPTARIFMLVFAWGGLITGVAGCLFAVLIGRVLPESFSLDQLIEHFAFVMVGGIATLFGPVLGAVLLAAEPELLRGLPGFEEILFGLLLVLIIAFMPRGIVGLLARSVPALRERFHR